MNYKNRSSKYLRKFFVIIGLIAVLAFSFLFVTYYQNNSLTLIKLEQNIDSLNQCNEELKLQISDIKKRNPNVQVVCDEETSCKLKSFRPFGLRLELTNVRPLFNDEIYLCVPAAFTSKKNTIDGLFFFKGKKVSEINPELNGGCIISENNIEIIDYQHITNELIAGLASNKKSFFQQFLLVKDSLIVPCKKFGDNQNLRRAIVKFNVTFCIIESEKKMTMSEFQNSLLKIGVIDALYLDMGTWSEGWYKDYNCNKITIGENMVNTNRQTSWLVYKKP